MKFVYQLLIFLLIFSVMLSIFAQFFPGHPESYDEQNPILADKNLRQYEGAGGSIRFFVQMIVNPNTLVVFLAVLGAAGIMSKVAGGSINVALLLGIGIFVATLVSVWTFAINTFSNLNYTNNLEITLMFDIINICIGILLMFTVVDLLTGQQGVEQ